MEEPKLDSSNLVTQLLALKSKLTENQLAGSRAEIETRRADNQQRFQEQIKALQDFTAKAAEAKKSGEIGKIFSWIALGLSAIAMVAAAVATVLTAGATAPVVAGLVVGMVALAGTVTMTGLQESGKMEELMKGLNDQKMGVTAGIQATLLALSILSAILSFEPAREPLPTPRAKPSKPPRPWLRSGQIHRAGRRRGHSSRPRRGADRFGRAQKEASDAQADAQSIKAKLQKAQSLIEDEMERIEKMLQEMDDSVTRVFSMMQSKNATTVQIAKNMV
ncbi:MAG: type III secretion system translocon subunit SctE [Candidatus Competibacteraceae bacterium]|nr:type III secretion system translocon subunit SctE [Candidatus Competibacteraceae bacterium]